MGRAIELNDAHVLVVDDEKFVRGMTRRILGLAGVANISEAIDGGDGLSKVMADPPDLVILDIMMEPMNGLKFLKTVRIGLSGGPRDLPVIVLTGSDEQSVFGTAMALDCNAFVRKNEGPDVIRERMTRVLDETFEIKESKAYQSVTIPDITIIKADEDVPASTEQPQEVTPPPTRACEIMIEDVEVGAVVARDVTTEDGNMLLTAGSVLSASYLNRLRDISGIIELSSIWVEQ